MNPSHAVPVRLKRSHPPQSIGSAWVLRGKITINPPHNDSDRDRNVEDDDIHNQNTSSQLIAAFGANFESLFGTMSAIMARAA